MNFFKGKEMFSIGYKERISKDKHAGGERKQREIRLFGFLMS